MASHGAGDLTGRDLPDGSVDQEYQGERPDRVCNWNLDCGDLLDLQCQYTGQTQNGASLAGPQQSFPTSQIWQLAEKANAQPKIPNHDLQQTNELPQHTDIYGLLTPISTRARNSPSPETSTKLVHELDGQSGEIWQHTLDATLEDNQALGDPGWGIPNQFGDESQEMFWEDFDLSSFHNSFGNDNTNALDLSGINLDGAALGQGMQIPYYHEGHMPDSTTDQPLNPFLTEINYPELAPNRAPSEFHMAQQGLNASLIEPVAAYNTAPEPPDHVDAFDAPKSAKRVPRILLKPSQKDNAKNALLIQWKEQGMSYKDIKAHGGFEEAESTLRGRYRTLTKPREARVRRPEWSARDVSPIH